MTICDCVEMEKTLLTEILDENQKNPELDFFSIFDGKVAEWSPRFEICEEIEQERRKIQTTSFEEEAEKCDSFQELISLRDSLIHTMGLPSPTKVINDSFAELCDCLSEAQSEEEAQACAPNKSMDDLEAIYNDCLNDMAEMEMEDMDAIAEEMEDMMEEALEEEGDYILTLEEELEALNEQRREHILHIRAYELDISEIEYELKTYDTIPNFDTELCVCYIDEGYMEPEIPCDYPEMSEDEWNKFGRDCDKYDFLKQEISWMNDYLVEDLHYLDVLDMDIEELEELEETLEEEDYEYILILSLEEELEELKENREATEREIKLLEEAAQYSRKLDGELCDCINNAESEEDAQACSPDKSMEEMEAIVIRCFDLMNDWIDISEELQELELVLELREDEINELEAEIQMEEEIDALLEAEHNPEGSDYDFNPDLAFKAQEIFSALESEDFDLFLDLVKVDTVDFFYWRIPSADFNRKNLEGMSIEIEGGNGPITVNALEYVEMFKDFDMHLLEQDKGRGKGSGYDGSCALRPGIAYCIKTNDCGESENDCYELMVFKDNYCLNYLLEEYGSIEELIPDPYLMRDALSHCSTQSEIWMAFDESNGFKFIGVYDWYWTP